MNHTLLFRVVVYLQAAAAKLALIRRQGVVNWACACIRAAPFVRGLLAKEKAKIAAKIAAGIQRDGLAITHLPKQGRPAKAVLELLKGEQDIAECRGLQVYAGFQQVHARAV
jgi:hypothetical protein